MIKSAGFALVGLAALTVLAVVLGLSASVVSAWEAANASPVDRSGLSPEHCPRHVTCRDVRCGVPVNCGGAQPGIK